MEKTKRQKIWYVASLFAGVAIGLGLASTIIHSKDADYGLFVFFVVPMVVGTVTSFMSSMGGAKTFWESFGLSTIALILIGSFVLFFAGEGAVCLAMALPITLLPLAFGALFGRSLAKDLRLIPTLAILTLLGSTAADEFYRPGRAAEIEYTSHVDIAAPPAVVWQNIVNLGKLPPAHDWMSSLGLACPETTELKGRGVGAERDCTLSTGPMRERVTAWEPDRRLGFIPLQTPPPMKELNPFGDPHPAHLQEKYFKVLYGEFQLQDLGNGHTRLFRVTRYEHRIRPAIYWTFWCNLGAGYAHSRVLDFVKLQSESSQATSFARR